MTKLTNNNDNNEKNIQFEAINDAVNSVEVSNKSVLYQQKLEADRVVEEIKTSIKDSETNITQKISENTIEIDEKIGKNNIMKNDDCEKCANTINNLSNDLQKLSSKQDLLEGKIANTNKILTILGTVIGLILTVFIFAVNIQYVSMKDSVDSKFDSIKADINSINQRLDYQEELNEKNIQVNVLNELKNQKIAK